MSLRIVLIRSDGPHHLYLERVLALHFDLIEVIEERGRDQIRRLRRRRCWTDWFWWNFHAIRRRLLGLDRYRSAYFAGGDKIVSGPSHRVTEVPWVNNPIVVSRLREAKPDVTVVIGTSILKDAVIDAAGPTIINIHGGHLPYYRGNFAFFFALYDGRPDLTGSTIHFIDRGIDTGDLIENIPAGARPGEIAEVLYCRAEMRAIHRLVELLHDYEAGIPLPRRPQGTKGRTYRNRDRKPHHDLILWFRLGAIFPPRQVEVPPPFQQPPQRIFEQRGEIPCDTAKIIPH